MIRLLFALLAGFILGISVESYLRAGESDD